MITILFKDDDTYFDLVAFEQRVQSFGLNSSDAQIHAACLFRRDGYLKWAFPYGGFGTVFTRGSLQRLIRPIFCRNDRTVRGPGDDTFTQGVCDSIHRNRIGERPLFREGMSVAELFHDYSALKMFCLHSDWLTGYIARYYLLSEPGNDIPELGEYNEELHNMLVWPMECGNRTLKCRNGSDACHRQTPANMEAFAKVSYEQSPSQYRRAPKLFNVRASSSSTPNIENVERQKQLSPPARVQLAPFCLREPFFERTNNRIVSVAKMIMMSRKEGKQRPVSLDPTWSAWYLDHFDERDDVILNYSSHRECHRVFAGIQAFNYWDWDLGVLGDSLWPRQDYIDQAEAILKSWPYSRRFMSVHRRHLEGKCHLMSRCADDRIEWVNKTHEFCLEERKEDDRCPLDLRLQICDMDYAFIKERNPYDLPVVLFTDGQVPSLDDTFPYRFNVSTSHLFVEMWLMARSTTHWSNPVSSVDAIVAAWRQWKNVEPKCNYKQL